MSGMGVGRKLTNLSLLVIALFMSGVGLLLLFLSGSVIPGDWPQLQAFASQLGGLLLATGLVTVAWEQWGRRTFVHEIMSMAKLSTDLQRSGIVRVTDQYLDDVALWSDLFRDVQKLDIVVAYASTWRNAHRARIQAAAKNPSARIRVFLPDPDDDQTMSTLAHRFSTSPAELQSKVREAISDFRSMSQPGGAQVRVYLRSGDLVYSCYRFGSRAVVTLYSHSRRRQTSVPTFVVDGGDLFKFVYSDLAAISAQSREAP